MNTIIWINDRKNDMENIVRGAFPMLWANKIIGKTVFLGNAVYHDMDNFDPEAFSWLVSDVLAMNIKSRYASENAGFKRALQEMNTYYEEEKPKDVFVLAPSDEKTASILGKWKNIISKQSRHDESDDETCKNAVQCVGEFFCENEKSSDNIIPAKSEYLYMLDVVLLDQEYKSLIDGQQDFVLSMALYYYITKKLNAKCFLYSMHTYLSSLQNNWINLYKKLDDDAPNNLEIIPRTQFFSGSLNIDKLNFIIGQFPKEKE